MMDYSTGVRKGTLPTVSLPNSKNAGDNQTKFLCGHTLNFNSDNTSSPKVIFRDEYEHMSRFHRFLCDEAVAVGDFIILENK